MNERVESRETGLLEDGQLEVEGNFYRLSKVIH